MKNVLTGDSMVTTANVSYKTQLEVKRKYKRVRTH